MPAATMWDFARVGHAIDRVMDMAQNVPTGDTGAKGKTGQ
jgi:hypothetical protein